MEDTWSHLLSPELSLDPAESRALTLLPGLPQKSASSVLPEPRASPRTSSFLSLSLLDLHPSGSTGLCLHSLPSLPTCFLQ